MSEAGEDGASVGGGAGERVWPDLAGRLIEGGRAHVLPVRVYFEDTDFSGLVYHASYVRWCERGRSDFLRLVGSEHRALIDGGATAVPAAFVVRRLAIEYLRPAKIDDVVEVVTRVGELTAAKTHAKAECDAHRGGALRGRRDGGAGLGGGAGAAAVGGVAAKAGGVLIGEVALTGVSLQG